MDPIGDHLKDGPPSGDKCDTFDKRRGMWRRKRTTFEYLGRRTGRVGGRVEGAGRNQVDLKAALLMIRKLSA